MGAAYRARVGLWLVCWIALGGCASRQRSPSYAVQEYVAALEAERYQVAYSMLASEVRAKLDYAVFVERMQKSRGEVRSMAESLQRTPAREEMTAVIELKDGATLTLVPEQGTWKLDSNPIDFYGRATPRQALRSFFRAYELEKWSVMLTFVPSRYRERMNSESVEQQFRDDEVRRTMSLLRTQMDAPIEVRGDEARLSYADGREVVFVREQEEWTIQDLD